MMKIINKLNRFLITGLIFVAAMLFVSCTNVPKTALDGIQNLRVENISSDKAVVLWDSVQNASEYQVIVKNISSGNYIHYFNTSEARYQAEGLEWAETYEITVNARPSDPDSFRYTEGPASSVTFKTLTPPVPAGEFTRPENLKAVVKNGGVTLTWDSVEGAEFYDIHKEYWRDDDSIYWDGIEETRCVEAVKTTYTDVLDDGTVKVLYKVCARNSNFSNTCYWSEKICVMF